MDPKFFNLFTKALCVYEKRGGQYTSRTAKLCVNLTSVRGVLFFRRQSPIPRFQLPRLLADWSIQFLIYNRRPVALPHVTSHNYLLRNLLSPYKLRLIIYSREYFKFQFISDDSDFRRVHASGIRLN